MPRLGGASVCPRMGEGLDSRVTAHLHLARETSPLDVTDRRLRRRRRAGRCASAGDESDGCETPYQAPPDPNQRHGQIVRL